MDNIADKQQRNRILIVLFVGVLMGALDIAIVAPALPEIQNDFGVDERSITWVFTTYVLFNLVGTPLMAKLSDGFGRRTVYIFAVALFGLGSLVVAVSPSYAVLLLGRAIQGFGSSGIFPVAAAVIGDTFPPDKRGRALGLIGAVFGIAFLIGPIVGGVILKFLNWHWLFIINIPIALALILWSSRLLPNIRPGIRKRFDIQGLLAISLCLAALTFGISQLDVENIAPDRVLESIRSPLVWPFIFLAVILIPVFWYIETRAEDPILSVKLFRSPQVRIASFLAMGAGLGEATLVFVPALLVLTFGVSTSTASFMLLPAVLAMAVGSPTAGIALDRRGSRVVVFVGAILMSLGMIAIGLLDITLVSFYLAALLVGLGLSALLGAPLRYIMLNEASYADRTAAQAVIRIFTATGQLIGGAMVGAIAASMGGGTAGFQSAYLMVGVIIAILGLLATRLKNQSAEMQTARQHAVIKSTETI